VDSVHFLAIERILEFPFFVLFLLQKECSLSVSETLDDRGLNGEALMLGLYEYIEIV
tara:strand:- start:355 stop:525 length:171 start_codon:yes stop_codon:yes gene_type:complete